MKSMRFTLSTLTLLARISSSAQPLETKLLANDGEENEYFGWTVALTGDCALIGAGEDDDLGPAAGSAYLFERAGGVWSQVRKLTASDGAAYDNFGNAIALSDSFAVIGAQLDDDRGTNSGSVYIFRHDGDMWIEETKLTASDGAEEDHFGSSVAISGDRIVVGCSLDDDLGVNSGSAYVFRQEGFSWIQEAKLLAGDGEVDDRFEEVSISGDYIVVGAWGDKDQGDLTGSAYIFRREGTSWIQEAKLTASDAAGGDQFGIDVSISVDRVLIGAHAKDVMGENSGAAYMFRRDGDVWTEEAKLSPADASDFDEFGIAVSISGSTAVVGADVDDDRGENSGSAYLFSFDGSQWTEGEKLAASDGKPYDYFGIAVAISASDVLVGAGGDDDNGADAGAAYVYGSLVSVEEDGERNAYFFGLPQNYPNPFNPRTVFSYALSAGSLVELSVYDLVGRHVATLVSEEQAPGNHEITWNATGHASGVYCYRLRAGEFVQTKKLLLLR